MIAGTLALMALILPAGMLHAQTRVLEVVPTWARKNVQVIG